MKQLSLAIVILLSTCVIGFAQQRTSSQSVAPVIDLPYYKTATRPGWEERGPQWNQWLAVGVRIGGGSGTICYYDPDTKYAYVISCGHLFNGYSLEYDPVGRKYTRTIDVFYHNKERLSKYRSYTAEVLAYRNFNESVYDVSLLRFKADWDIEWYAPIAPIDYKLVKGQYYHSTGCDGRSEVAHYLVEYVRESNQGSVTEIVTQKNNPRGGRSGGGVMTDDGQLIFICSRGGGGYGYWTSLQQIHRFLNEEKEFKWLLDVGINIPQKIPVVDTKDPNRKFHEKYIPLPW